MSSSKELTYHKRKNKSTVVILEKDDGTYEVACYSAADIEEWSHSYDNEDEAWREFKRVCKA